MENTTEVEGYKCELVGSGSESRIAYMIYPEIAGLPEKWLAGLAEKYDVAVAMVYVPADDWNDSLTPWPEQGETRESPPFAGKAGEFLEVLTGKIVPEAEKTLGMKEGVERDLIGVSLSGLFTLWQWMGCDAFRSIASISGSFWYPGFLEWFEKTPVPEKTGKAFFLLGRDEPKAWIKAYRSVGTNTQVIVDRLKTAGIPTEFQWVPGNHFVNPLPRAEAAFAGLYKSSVAE